MQTILVPLDGSPQAEQVLPLVASFARAVDSPLMLVQVIEHPYPDSAATAEQALAGLTERLRSHGIAADSDILHGDPASCILQAARTLQAGLIAMRSYRAPAAGPGAFGSVASRVVHGALVPVLLLPAAAGGQDDADLPKELLVPLDGSALSERALPWAAGLAHALKLPVRLFRAVNEQRFGLYGSVTAAGHSEHRPHVQRSVQHAREYLEAHRDRLRVQQIDAAVEVTSGDPAACLVEATARDPRPLVVMSSRGRSGRGSFVRGSMAGRLLEATRNPVLLISRETPLLS